MTIGRPDSTVGEAVCAAIRGQVAKLGLLFDADEPRWDDARFEAQADPFSREESLVGTWRGQARYGTVTVFPDGRVFAEYQVLQPHPTQAGCYVEAVQVWGRPGALKGGPVVVAGLK